MARLHCRWGDIEEVHAMCPLNGHSAGIRAITYSPCGQYLATGGEDKVRGMERA
jgi:WD40 repeat protein